MNNQFLVLAESKREQLVRYRRDFHRHPEVAWTEFRTASIVADRLAELGYEVFVGNKVMAEEEMMGVPSAAELEAQAKRALSQGAKQSWVDQMAGGKTGVMAVLKFKQTGPTVVFRFDLDANDVMEAQEHGHRPFREGFASINEGAMHACGHDGHTAIGLVLAESLSDLKQELQGTVKFIFQPAEEGVRGAKAMVAKGVVDDADYLIGLHLGIGIKQTGLMTCNTEGFLATTKLDAEFKGVAAHAGADPETGRNALLAAATAALNLHAIARHSQGASRINVGVLQAGTGRNVVPAQALLKLETRGTTSEVNSFMVQEARRILKAAAQMYDVDLCVSEMGGAAGCCNSLELVTKLNEIAEESRLFKQVLLKGNFGGSEDCTCFMERVQQQGGQAAYLMVGTDLAAGHHDSCFDFDENVLVSATAFLTQTAAALLHIKS